MPNPQNSLEIKSTQEKLNELSSGQMKVYNSELQRYLKNPAFLATNEISSPPFFPSQFREIQEIVYNQIFGN